MRNEDRIKELEKEAARKRLEEKKAKAEKKEKEEEETEDKSSLIDLFIKKTGRPKKVGTPNYESSIDAGMKRLFKR